MKLSKGESGRYYSKFSKSLATTLSLLSVAVGVCAVPGHAQSLDDIAAPITDPTIFEDPRSTTELRPIFIYHKISDDFVTGGGSATIYALQARYAVNDRFSVIATKDGYVNLKSDSVLDDQTGWGDVSAGVKYAAYYNPADRQILTLGFRYDAPVGSEDVFQGQGKGAFNPFISAAMGLGPINVMAGTGFRIAASPKDSSFYDFDLHVDTKLCWFHPVLEMSVTSVTQAGEGLPIGTEGEDYFNFGATKAAGATLVTGAVGGRFDIADNVTFGVAYQFPMSGGTASDILDYRITSDMIFRF